MNIEAKVKRILPAETLTFQDGRTYTQQLIILDCGEHNRSTGGVLRKRHPNLFRRTPPRQVSRHHRGCKGRSAIRTERTRLHLHRQGGRQDAARGIQPKNQCIRHQGARTVTARAGSTTINATAATSTDASTHGLAIRTTTSTTDASTATTKRRCTTILEDETYLLLQNKPIQRGQLSIAR